MKFNYGEPGSDSGSFQAGIGKPGTQNLDLARSEKEALFRAGIQE
jgi:hypothetical protein